MSFDADEIVPYKGQSVTKGVLFHKVKSLGWSSRAFAELSDEEIVRVMDNRLTPAALGKTQPTTDPKSILETEEGSDPGIMSGAPRTGGEDGPPPGAPSVVTPLGPPAAQPASRTHARPIDPTRPSVVPNGAPAGVPAPQMQRPITVKPPRTDRAKLQSMLDAAFELAQNEATRSTAKTLLQVNGLERAFQSLHGELAMKLFGRIDSAPDNKCRGGIVLDIELEAENGYVHIITTAGVITFTGHQLIHKGSE